MDGLRQLLTLDELPTSSTATYRAVVLPIMEEFISGRDLSEAMPLLRQIVERMQREQPSLEQMDGGWFCEILHHWRPPRPAVVPAISYQTVLLDRQIPVSPEALAAPTDGLAAELEGRMRQEVLRRMRQEERQREQQILGLEPRGGYRVQMAMGRPW